MKSFFERYGAYLKNNPEHYWFKRKLYGWGWTPATKEGWITMLVFVLLVIGNIKRLEMRGLSESALATCVLLETSVLVLILLIICYKTGEKPRWQWGMKEEKDGENK